jgi:hypothetical protein
MASVKLEQRVAALEAELARLRQRLEGPPSHMKPWWERIAGTFANDPEYDRAMELGRKHRRSLRPKSAKPRTR